MAITRIVSAKLAIVGDGAATTYALTMTTSAVFEVCDQAPSTPPAVGLSVALAAQATGVFPASGITQIQKIPYTVAYATNVVTVTFATAPASGVVDYLVIGLVVP